MPSKRATGRILYPVHWWRTYVAEGTVAYPVTEQFLCLHQTLCVVCVCVPTPGAVCCVCSCTRHFMLCVCSCARNCVLCVCLPAPGIVLYMCICLYQTLCSVCVTVKILKKEKDLKKCYSRCLNYRKIKFLVVYCYSSLGMVMWFWKVHCKQHWQYLWLDVCCSTNANFCCSPLAKYVGGLCWPLCWRHTKNLTRQSLLLQVTMATSIFPAWSMKKQCQMLWRVWGWVRECFFMFIHSLLSLLRQGFLFSPCWSQTPNSYTYTPQLPGFKVFALIYIFKYLKNTFNSINQNW